MKNKIIEYENENNMQKVNLEGELKDKEKNEIMELSDGMIFKQNMRQEEFGIQMVEEYMFGKKMIQCEIGKGKSYVNMNGKKGIVVKNKKKEEI